MYRTGFGMHCCNPEHYDTVAETDAIVEEMRLGDIEMGDEEEEQLP